MLIGIALLRQCKANPIPALLSGIVLVYQPSMLDILPMYVVLMLLAPISLRLMQRYKTTGMTIVLATSLLIWVLPHIGIGNLAWLPKALTVQVGAFNWLAWQLIFVSGMVIGFIRLERKGKPWQPKISLMLLSLLAISFLYLQRHRLYSCRRVTLCFNGYKLIAILRGIIWVGYAW